MKQLAVQTTELKPEKKKGLRRRKIAKFLPYLWLLPCMILVFTFILAPVVETVLLSLSRVSSGGMRKNFNGFENYKKVFSLPEFGPVMLNTFIWDAGIVAVSMILGLVMALVLNESFRGRKAVRTVMLLPWATSGLITAACWKYIFDYQYGALNALLLKLGIIKTNINFLGAPESAFACMMVVGVIVTVPFITFTLLSGLESIPRDYYEAAVMDGATFFQRLFKITLPLIKPNIDVSIVLNAIYAFNSFTIVHTITNGAPAYMTATIMILIYREAFSKNKFGLASATSMIGFVILLIFALVYMKLLMKEEK